ncbi:MAG: hypothetical protein Q8R36_03720 [bacterium]|nr:hypothetical protein [bacterium]
MNSKGLVNIFVIVLVVVVAVTFGYIAITKKSEPVTKQQNVSQSPDNLSRFLDTSSWKLVEGIAEDTGAGQKLRYQIKIPADFSSEYLDADLKTLVIGHPRVTVYGSDNSYRSCAAAQKGENRSSTEIKVAGVSYFSGYYYFKSEGVDVCYYLRYSAFFNQLEESYEYKLLINSRSVDVSFDVLYPRSQESNYPRDELLRLFEKILSTFRLIAP